MKYLIDTNILLWFLENNPKLPSVINEILMNDESEIFLSIISLWEISIKHNLGKLKIDYQLNEIFEEVVNEDFFTLLELKPSHILKQSELPFYHRDPFDRLIYAQSISENLQFLFTDEIFNLYILQGNLK